MSGRKDSIPPRSCPAPDRPPVENWMIISGQCFLIPSCNAANFSGSEDGVSSALRTCAWQMDAPASYASWVDSICSAMLIGTAGLAALVGTDPVMATQRMQGFGMSVLRRYFVGIASVRGADGDLAQVSHKCTPAVDGLPLLDELGQDHNPLAFNAALDVGRVVLDKTDFVHSRAAFGGEAATFDGQVLDQHHGITTGQRLTIAVLVIGLIRHVISPGTGVVIKVQLIGEVMRPRLGYLGEHAGGEHLNGRIIGPHGAGKGAEVIRVWSVELIGADAADVGGGVNGATGNRGGDQRRVGCGAEGACHERGVRRVWPARNVICRGVPLAEDTLGYQKGGGQCDDRTDGRRP